MIDDWFVEHDGQRLVLDQEKVQAAIEAKQAIEDELRAELAIAECLATEMSDRSTQLDSLQERVKELETLLRLQEDAYRSMKSRATRAWQERDEAYERAAKEAESHCYGSTGRAIAKHIRRLASGPDKEKRE